MVRESVGGVEMVRRSMTRDDAVRTAYDALQAGRFATAREASRPWRHDAAGALLHALGSAGAGEVESPAQTLAAIAQANPAARHPVQDLVELLRRHGRGADAVPHLRAALRHRPGDAPLTVLLGTVLAEDGCIEEAVGVLRQVTAVRPDDGRAWSNLGKALAAALRFQEAEAAFSRAAALAPGDAQLALNHGVARLKAGDFRGGWPLFRRRHALAGRAPPLPGPELSAPDQIGGRTVLLIHDEGFGDTIQFVRYAPLLADRGARVLLSVPPPLARLLAGSGFALLPDPAASIDLWCRIADLPAVFGTTAETIPAPLPYLAADPALVRHWSARLPPGFRVGLVWAGAARTHDPAAMAADRVRSLPAAQLAPLLAEDVTWISLQQGHAPPPGVFDPMPAVADFADTAAIVASLDLVVSVDTAVAHLAAAMGRPVLLLDRFDNCWRWLHGRTDSPWYPGVLQIVRQSRPGDWAGVIDRAAMLVRAAVGRGR